MGFERCFEVEVVVDESDQGMFVHPVIVKAYWLRGELESFDNMNLQVVEQLDNKWYLETFELGPIHEKLVEGKYVIKRDGSSMIAHPLNDLMQNPYVIRGAWKKDFYLGNLFDFQ